MNHIDTQLDRTSTENRGINHLGLVSIGLSLFAIIVLVLILARSSTKPPPQIEWDPEAVFWILGALGAIILNVVGLILGFIAFFVRSKSNRTPALGVILNLAPIGIVFLWFFKG